LGPFFKGLKPCAPSGIIDLSRVGAAGVRGWQPGQEVISDLAQPSQPAAKMRFEHGRRVIQVTFKPVY
jgi:hypothetical protein